MGDESARLCQCSISAHPVGTLHVWAYAAESEHVCEARGQLNVVDEIPHEVMLYAISLVNSIQRSAEAWKTPVESPKSTAWWGR